MAFTLLWQPAAVRADDEGRLILNAGGGEHTAYGMQLGYGRDWPWSWQLSEDIRLHTLWEADLDWFRWENRPSQGAKNALGIGITPGLQLRIRKSSYVEAGVGPHVIANTRDSNRLSTALEFCSLIGVGFALSEKASLGYRFVHYSNAGIETPNSGINLHNVHFVWHF